MSNVVRIDVEGVNVNADGAVSAASLEAAINERVTAVFTMEGTTGPAIDDEVLFYLQDGVTPMFGGLVLDTRCVGVSENNPTNNLYEVECVDWERFTDWCSLTLDYPVATALEDVLADMITAGFGDYSLTYTPTATGVMLAPFSWVAKPGNECVRELRDRTNLIIQFNADKSITTSVPGATPGLFAITDANLYRLAKFDVNTKGRELANKVVLTFGPTGPGEVIEHTWIADGVATSFSLEGLNIRASDVWPGIVTVDGTPYPIWPVGDGPADGITWAHRVDDGTLTFTGAFTAYIPNGAVIVLRYSPLFPFVIERETGATPPREYRASNASILRYDVGVEIADQVLARTSQAADARVVELVTDEVGFDIGQALEVDTTARGGVVADFLIATVSIELVNAELWVTTITATEGDQPQMTYQGEWEQVTGGGGGGSSAGVSVVVSVSGEGVGWTNIGATSWGVGTGFWREYNGGAPRIRFGSVAGNRFVYDETGALTVVSERLTIDDAGVLIAPDNTARAELSGFRFGTGFGLYGTQTASNLPRLELYCEASGFTAAPRVVIKARDTTAAVESYIQVEDESILISTLALTISGGSLAFGTPVNGAVVYSTATALAYTAAGTSGQVLRSAGAASPVWSTATYPATVTANQILHGTATNVIGGNANFVFDGTNVGIGTAAPGERLHIYDATSAKLKLDAAAGGSPQVTWASAGVNLWQLYRPSSGTDLRLYDTANAADRVTFQQGGNVGIGTTAPTAALHLKAGASAASSAPLKFTSGTNLTTAEAGAVEYNGTNLFFTRAGTVRENVLVAIDNVAAPSTTGGFAITNYYGSGATNFLGDPNRWLSVNVLGATYKIPLYT